MTNGKKIIAVIPAYNTEKTLEMTVRALPPNILDEMLVVNDGSTDHTAAIAKGLPVTVITHEKNKGYGGAQKTGYREALLHGADIVVMVHADFQYDPARLPALLAPLIEGTADACFGSRMHSKRSARAGGMPWWRFIANIGLTFVLEIIYRLHLSEYHTGYRAYSAGVLRAIPFEKNSNNYVFDSEMIAELALGKFRVAEVPIPTRYAEYSQSPSFYKSVVYGFSTLGVAGKYILSHFGAKYPQFEINREPH